MGTLKESVNEILRTTISTIKENKILDAATKAILSYSLPAPFGEFLVNLYENATGSEEDKTKQLIQILENLQKFNTQQFDELKNIIQESGDIIKDNRNSLFKLLEITTSVADKLDEIEYLIHQLSEKGTNEIDEIKDTINKLEDNLLEEIQKLGMSKFDYNITAEQLLFYLKLKYFLDHSYQIFHSQNIIARNLYNEILKKGHNVTNNKKGLDYTLYNFHANNMMDFDDLKKFNYIRKVTDDTEKFNWYAKELLLKNRYFVSNSVLLKQLLIHYSTWQAKYQLYKDNENMCLIYVGPDQFAGFPSEIDNHIKMMIAHLKKKINLID